MTDPAKPALIAHFPALSPFHFQVTLCACCTSGHAIFERFSSQPLTQNYKNVDHSNSPWPQLQSAQPHPAPGGPSHWHHPAQAPAHPHPRAAGNRRCIRSHEVANTCMPQSSGQATDGARGCIRSTQEKRGKGKYVDAHATDMSMAGQATILWPVFMFF